MCLGLKRKEMNIMNCMDEVKLVYKTTNKNKIQIKSIEKAEKYCRSCFDIETIELKEYAYAIFLNRQSLVLGFIKISEGGTCGTVIDIKNVLQTALLVNSSRVILTHNHPSGNINTSGPDDNLTKKLKEALTIIDMELMDHIIITAEDYYSYSSNNDII